MKFTLTRESYLPEVRTKIEFNDARFEAYVGERKSPSGSYPTGTVFVGKAVKPSYHYRFKTSEDAENAVRGYVTKMQGVLKARAEAKIKRRAERNVAHTFKVGDILVSSWGYDQTNINFYQVVGLKGKLSVEIREIASKVVDNAISVDYVVAVKDSFIVEGWRSRERGGKPMIKRVIADNYVKISSYEYAYRWDGKPRQETAMGWGH